MTATRRVGLVASALAVFSLIEPRASFLGPWSSLVCLLVFLRLLGEGLHSRLLPALVGIFSGLIAIAGYNLESDSQVYMSTTASLAQDFDLDVGNQYMGWRGWAPSRGPAGMSIIQQPVGSAFVWVIPALLADRYVQLAGGYQRNFYSPPYFGAIIAANLILALSGALALARLLSRESGSSAAGLAVAASILASPIVYYLAVQPLMIHGVVFALTCWGIVLIERAVETDSASAWRGAGFVLGLAALCRFQAAVLFVLVPLVGWTSPRVFARRVLNFSVPAFIAVLPQIVVSMKTFGRPFAMPQGSGFMDWSSPHWVETLISADRGLFNWHPLLIPGFLGLLMVRGSLRRFALSGLAIFAITAWTNGGVRDFNGADAFGGRRYDLVIPFFALGLASMMAAVRPFLAKRPLALPALLFTLAALWNVSFMTAYRAKSFRTTAPVDELAATQVDRLHRLAKDATDWMGPRARFRVYDAFVGLYTYIGEYRPGGDFDLATLEPRFLRSGWSDVRGWDDGTLFRYVLFPRACIVIPLQEPFDLRGYVLARAPARIRDQRVTITLNGRAIAEAGLPAAWIEVPFVAPASSWVRGENEFCLRLAKRSPGDEGDDLSFAAAVARIQLP